MTALLALVALWGPGAEAAPLTVHAIVLSDPRDGDEGARLADRVAGLLGGSGAYDLIDVALVEGRVGEAAGALYGRCASDVGCWRAAATTAGVEQVVLVERVDAGTVGLRVLDVAARGPFRQDMAPLVAGRPDPRLVERLLFAPGALRLRGCPEGAVLRLDATRELRLAGEHVLAPLAAGKHVLEMEAPGHLPWFTTVIVAPGVETVVDAALVPVDAPRPAATRWTTWWAICLAALGAAALAAGGGARGVAIER